jgi:hypothetical protein
MNRRLMVAGALAVGLMAAGAASAQYDYSPTRPGQQVFTGQDVSVAFEAVRDLLDGGAVGETRPWINPQNGHGGLVEIVRSYEEAGKPCRDVRVSNTAAQRGMAYVVQVCRFADRGWALAG